MKVCTTLSKIPFSIDLQHLQNGNLALRGISTLFKSWYYELLADISKSVSPDKVKRYNDISARYYGNSITLLFNYAVNPAALIAPSLNTPREYHEHKGIYKKFSYNIFLYNREHDPILKDTICMIGGVLPIFIAGFCTGMSMEFVSEYFKTIKHRPHAQALLEVTQQFSEGASKKAIYSQYLCNITSHPYHVDGCSEIRLFLMHRAAASLFDNLDYPQIKNFNNFYANEDIQCLQKEMGSLPEGIYDISLLGRFMKGDCKTFGHTIVYSNIQDKSFVFCPTLGSFSISQQEPTKNFFYLLDMYEKIDKFQSTLRHLIYVYIHPIHEK